MTPFLLQIAEAYIQNKRNSLIDYYFVFPNKRAVTFFTNYLVRLSNGKLILPQCGDIDSLVMEITESIVPSHIEQILILFNCYKEIVIEAGGEADLLSLEAFIPWGEMVLTDFNDVDLYLASPEEVFKNLKHFKELSASFLTEEQIKIIESYWGREFLEYWNDEHLWQHIQYEEKNKDTVKNFLRLWFLMYPLYQRFNNALSSKGKRYSGNAYRTLAELISYSNPFERHYSNVQFVFVGFNQLSRSQEKIFDFLKGQGKASFWWDDASAAFRFAENPASRQIQTYKKRYPSDDSIIYDFDKHIPTELPEFEIIGVPSHYSEVKMGAKVLEDMLKDAADNGTALNLQKTAFVVPEEIMVLPLIDSIPKYKNASLPPDKIDLDQNLVKVNVTMAYPLKNSPFASLYKLIQKLYERATSHEGELAFYYKDIIALFSHPAMRTANPQLCLDIVTLINKGHIFNVKRSFLTENAREVAELFPAVTDSFALNQFDPVRAQLVTLRGIFPEESIEASFASAYLRALDTLERLCEEYDILLDFQTILNQLGKIASSDAVHFTGEPLEGVQVMGMLETRALDFENIIFLGANERVFPRKQPLKSFIPMSLRRAYDLPTSDTADNVAAYYFYRLIGRARKVFMIYDARGGTGGEMSRYIYQLLYIYSKMPDAKIRHHVDYFLLNSTDNNTISIPKSEPWIKEALDKLRTPGSGDYISASILKDYLECPLKFFLKKIAKYDINDDLKDYIEDSGFGTIVHSVLEHLYAAESVNNPSFFPKDLNVLRIAKKSVIVREVVRALRSTLYAIKEENAKLLPDNLLTIDSLPGEHALLASVIVDIVNNVLAAEAEFNDIEYFNYIAGEEEIKDNISFSPELNVNIRGFIDRIDKVKLPGNAEPVLRFIDYKTGNEPVRIPSEDALFNPELSEWPKGLFQLFFYCHVYSIKHKVDIPIIPQIYPIRQLKKNKLTFSKFGTMKEGKKTVSYNDILDYRELESFPTRINNLLAEIFNENVPFDSRPSDSACKYCKFKSICNR